VATESLTLYGIPNCDTCRKARAWLEGQGVAYRFHDLRADGLTAATVKRWLASDFDDKVVNKRSTTWRTLDETQRVVTGPALVGLLVDHPTLVKRPVFERHGEVVAVGFDARSTGEAIV